MDKKPEGCEECRQRVYSGTWPPPERIGVSEDGPAFLHLCKVCGTYWQFDLRMAYPISEDLAREAFPDVFLSKGGRSTS
jgi:hypothetical protein